MEQPITPEEASPLSPEEQTQQDAVVKFINEKLKLRREYESVIVNMDQLPIPLSPAERVKLWDRLFSMYRRTGWRVKYLDDEFGYGLSISYHNSHRSDE